MLMIITTALILVANPTASPLRRHLYDIFAKASSAQHCLDLPKYDVDIFALIGLCTIQDSARAGMSEKEVSSSPAPSVKTPSKV